MVFSIQQLKEREDHTQDEIDAIGRAIPVRVLKDPVALSLYARVNTMSLRDALSVIEWVAAQEKLLSGMKVCTDITYGECMGYYELAQTNTIVIHRVNYILRDSMLRVYDTLERDGKMRFGVRKAMRNAEKIWHEHVMLHYRVTERSAWNTLQDHLWMACDAVNPYLEKVYEAIRDYMIGKGMRDVELKSRCAVSLLMGRVAAHSFRKFFQDFEKESGVDYSRCFADDDMQPMVSVFASMCDMAGVKTHVADDGCYMTDFSPEDSVRYRWAWDAFMAALRDDDLMDESARKAIDLNPAVREEYMHILEEAEQKAMRESVEKLRTKYKVV